ncbi:MULTISPECIES: HlyD family efflux transporter periplasmic adaptor subunit [Pseudoalteromonas]|uniref:efflux RND transporter periplasmic adaptor subunit n=1 Tax=Pseudoalteromonas TaxID=53246 RepID=UPI00020A0581|nr:MULTISPECIES: HlyD family efflux transporter periplasmic adaptor subunit [Pseudoalteromonas]EGI73010.1 ABC transporter permease [Pseudoalteromonas distincta]KAA1161934.1 HlyD family efflux transporter periplasmic adaptor subunit [Pseudoalteromonas distincta]MDN3476387.1 HlyD family efflux transporter periplasmic adaptor subunit [Pseudoalteromonas sp. APC 3355]|tara:strand:- start:97991 stop:99244 length:1254 start_codon:yes stop_codon:yes gene_type:complete
MIKDTSAQDVQVKAPINYKKYAIITAIVFIVVSTVAYIFLTSHSAKSSISRSKVQVAKVHVKALIRDIAASGKIVAANAPKIYSPERGFIDLKVKAGDTVKQGDTLALLQSPELTNELKQQESVLKRLQGEQQRQHLQARRQTLTLNKTLDMAQVELNAAERENRRAQLSIQKHLISQIDLEKAVDDLSRAKLSYKHAQQEVLLAKDTLAFELQAAKSDVTRQQLIVDDLIRKVSNLSIKATVTGIVGNLLVQQKAAVTQSQPLMTLVDLSNFEAELQVPESYANELGLGMEVELKLGNETVMGNLSAISPEVNNREVTARVRFKGVTNNIRQNQRLTARILLDNREGVMQVKRGAFMQQGGIFAYKVEGNIAKRIPITIGATSINAVELLSGLKENDEIIISSYSDFKQADTILLN